MAIKIKSLETEAKEEVPYADGVTVEKTLKAAGVKNYGKGYTVTADGTPVKLGDRIADGVEVVVTKNAKNG